MAQEMIFSHGGNAVVTARKKAVAAKKIPIFSNASESIRLLGFVNFAIKRETKASRIAKDSIWKHGGRFELVWVD